MLTEVGDAEAPERGDAELVTRRAAVAGARSRVEPAAIGCCAEAL